MSDPVLDPAAITAALDADGGPDWHLVAGKLVKTVVCADFMGALAYVMAVGRLAEEADHHPDIDIRYRRVTLALISHDSDGVTRRDLDLARAIDGVTDGHPE
jgi:4a-hydroxytetrahydrobiopterin dehydratase